ncbi:MAG: LD-carboxypeptidase [Deltaproteobacteria bacterium]|nr:LD-carboxypeptidase [Deltaproteobacteria bacterium]
MVRGTALKAPALRKGDRVRVVAPAGPFSRDLFEAGIQRLRDWGLEPVWAADIFAKEGYLAGTDERRLRELHEALADKSSRAIFCARGGYGSMRLLSKFDLRRLRSGPKLVLGFSDNTALLWDLFRRSALCGIHGPMVASKQLTEIRPARERWLRRLIFSAGAPGRVPSFRLRGRVGGRAAGFYYRGNLTLITHLLAAGRAPRFDERLLVLEDVGESAYRIDRMLTTLRLAGVFDRAAGGRFRALLTVSTPPNTMPWQRISRVVSRARSRRERRSGHGRENVALPVGTRAVLDTHREPSNFWNLRYVEPRGNVWRPTPSRTMRFPAGNWLSPSETNRPSRVSARLRTISRTNLSMRRCSTILRA